MAESPQYLVCPPDYYEVSYIINPWMRPDVWQQEKDRWTARAREQWATLTATMRRLGWGLKEIPPQPGLPDMVFSANHALVIGGKALIARYAKSQRQGETPHAEAWFKKEGFQTHVPPMAFEGAGDALYDPELDVVFMGHGFRTVPEAAQEIESFLGKKVVPLALRDPRFYHLDTCLCPLTGRRALVTPLAFTEESLAILKAHYGDGLIFVSDSDALQYACNAVNVGQDIVLPAVGESTASLLKGLGYRLHLVTADSYLLAGGSCRCLTLRLDQV